VQKDARRSASPVTVMWMSTLRRLGRSSIGVDPQLVQLGLTA
jgi:hypothetical protein